MKMEKNNRWYLLLGIMSLMIVAMIAMPYILFENIKQTTNRVIAPVEDINQQLRTQVSELMHPTPTILPDPVSIIHEMRSLSRLETIQYSVEKIITAESGQDEFKFLFGDRLIFVAHGNVVAGIDLADISTDDIEIEGEELVIHLPEPEVFIATLDNDKSYIYDRTLGILTKGNTNLETDARKAAEEEILKAALEDGILEKAGINGEVFLDRFLQNLGYKKVVFSQE
jgi:hypothetical protein